MGLSTTESRARKRGARQEERSPCDGSMKLSAWLQKRSSRSCLPNGTVAQARAPCLSLMELLSTHLLSPCFGEGRQGKLARNLTVNIQE